MLGGLGLVGWLPGTQLLLSCGHFAPGILMYLGYRFEGNQSLFFLSEEMMKLVIYSAESINLQKGR